VESIQTSERLWQPSAADQPFVDFAWRAERRSLQSSGSHLPAAHPSAAGTRWWHRGV